MSILNSALFVDDRAQIFYWIILFQGGSSIPLCEGVLTRRGSITSSSTIFHLLLSYYLIMRATYFLLLLILFSCNEKTEMIKIDSAVFKWFEEAREHSINLVYDISEPKNRKGKYIGTVIAEYDFINDLSCREDTIYPL